MEKELEHSILKAPIERFLQDTDRIDDHIWGFKFLRDNDDLGSSSSVIGVYIEEIHEIADSYNHLVSEINRLSLGACSTKACKCLNFKANEFPRINTDRFTINRSRLPNPFSHFRRFKITLEFQDIIRNIQAILYQIVDCLDFIFTGKSHFLPETFYKDHLFT